LTFPIVSAIIQRTGTVKACFIDTDICCDFKFGKYEIYDHSTYEN